MGRLHHPDATAIKILAYERFMGPGENLCDGALGLPVAPGAGDAHEHLITVHSTAQGAVVEIHIGATILGQQPGEAIAMSRYLAAHQGELFCHDIAAPPIHHQLAITTHGPQATAERLQRPRAL